MLNDNKIQIGWPVSGTVITTESGMTYTIGPLLNDSGGFGLLYDGHDTFGNSVAIKIFKPANRKYEDVQQQWESEVSILDLVRHPNIVFIHDAFICENLFYIVFEKAWGNVYELVKQQGPLNEFTVKEMARQLLFALHYIHNHGILHKDITAYNILFFQSGHNGHGLYKVSDFGISEEFTDRWTSTNPIAHRLFKPPELVKFGYTTMQSDLYHLGLVLYYCLKGVFPYDTNLNQSKLNEAILNGVPRLMAEKIGTALGQFISILLRRREEYRFQSELEAWQYLQKI